MIYALFISVIVLGIFTFLLQKKDASSPSFLACVLFAISIFINLLNADRWGTSYSWKAYTLIMLGLTMIAVGEYVIKLILKSKKKDKIEPCYTRNKKIITSPINIGTITIATIIIISIACLLIDIKIMGNITGSSNVFSSLFSSRNVLTSGEVQRGLLGRIVLAANKGIALTLIYIIIHNKVLCEKRNKISYFIPIALFLTEAILTTRRTIFLRIIAYTFIVFIILYISKNGTKVQQLNKVMLIGIGALCSFMLIFSSLGKLIGKGQYDAPIDVFYYYSGSSINLFNKYISSGAEPESNYFGEHTLYGIYNSLHYISPSIQHNSNPALENTYLPHWYSNIYTAFRRYYQDYGIIGIVVIPFILGVFYGYLESKAKRNLGKPWNTIFFAYSIYPIIEIAIDERFLVNYISFSTFFEVTMLYIFYRFLARNGLQIKPANRGNIS
ncbi:oligosaccharide repeat unit polymerase [Candidatus Saccharibacteria bacterium]|nr:oligosaccharide repeat unit polymerase [Candidatus Saccharibacteria bacterium]